jgi:diguanylate cyclase (GGDEF)-like protein
VPGYEDQSLLSRVHACWDKGRVGRSHEGLVEARRLLIEARRANDLEALAGVNRCIGWFCLQLGFTEDALKAANEARNYYAGVDDNWGHALSLAVYSWALLDVGLSDIGFESAAEATVIAARTDDLALNAFALNCKAIALVMCLEDKLAVALLDEALELANLSGDMSTRALTLVNFGYAKMNQVFRARAEGRRDAESMLAAEAMDFVEQAVEVAREAGDLWNLRVALCNGAELFSFDGNIERAKALLAEWDDLPGVTGPREDIHYIYSKGDVLYRLDRNEEALELYRDALRLADQSALHDHKVNALRRLCEIKAKRGEFEQALSYHRAFHDAYVAQTGEMSRRRAHALDMQLQNDKLREKAAQLEMQAGLDPLTGIPNRRAFDAVFSQLSHQQAVVGILDIDHFKLVNDHYSHLVGDQVLIRVAGLVEAINPAMQIFRIGGEEFALVFAGMSLEHAEPLATLVVNAVRRLDLGDIAKGLQVTVSIGLAESGVLAGTALLAEADRRLYVAKKAGRDRLIADARSSILAVSA